MNSAQFQALQKDFLEHEEALLGVKKTEYATDVDRLINFKEASQMAGLTPEHYCYTLISKHAHAIRKVALGGSYLWCWNNDIGEGMKQRIADERNYLLLFAGILEEKDGISTRD